MNIFEEYETRNDLTTRSSALYRTCQTQACSLVEKYLDSCSEEFSRDTLKVLTLAACLITASTNSVDEYYDCLGIILYPSSTFDFSKQEEQEVSEYIVRLLNFNKE